MIHGGGKEETEGTINFNIYENYHKVNEDLKDTYHYYKKDFPLAIKKNEELLLPTMYQQIKFTIKYIDEDDNVKIKSTMTFHDNEDYSDQGYDEIQIKPGESKIMYFNGPDNQGYVTVRYDK